MKRKEPTKLTPELRLEWARKLKESGFEDIEHFDGGPYLERHHLDTTTAVVRSGQTLAGEVVSLLSAARHTFQYSTMAARMALSAVVDRGVQAFELDRRQGMTGRRLAGMLRRARATALNEVDHGETDEDETGDY